MADTDTKLEKEITEEETTELEETELPEHEEEVTTPEALEDSESDNDIDISGDLEKEDLETEKTKVIDVIKTTELPVVDESLFETTTISKIDLDKYVNKKEKTKTGKIDKDKVVEIDPDEVESKEEEKEEVITPEEPKIAVTAFLAYASSILFAMINIIGAVLLDKGYITIDNMALYATLTIVAEVFLLLTIILSTMAVVRICNKKNKGTILIVLSIVVILIGTLLSDTIAKFVG